MRKETCRNGVLIKEEEVSFKRRGLRGEPIEHSKDKYSQRVMLKTVPGTCSIWILCELGGVRKEMRVGLVLILIVVPNTN